MKSLTYGSEPLAWFSSTPDIAAPAVKLPDFLADWSRNVNSNLSNAYHLFDSSSVPLKARVWFPEGDGPFPFVIIVHGNDPNSEPGFKYLGELLASRGYIVSQVDETDFWDLIGEIGARGWLLLNHLELWRKWNRDEGSIFYNKVDLEKIALIGMSRGGEAVAHAATFNQWNKMPKTNEALDFNFSIKAVISLAPSDMFYGHTDGPNYINNVNYMVLQGGHDEDAYQFLGSRQWLRTRFDDSTHHIKAALYIYRANHINFNRTLSAFFNKSYRKGFDARLITPKQQEELTKFFVSAFLEASLFNKTELFELVKHPQVQPGWPEDIYISRYLESNFKIIADFEKGEGNTSVLGKSGNKLVEVSDVKIVAERLRGGTEIGNKVLEINLSPVNSEIHVIVKLPKSFISNLNKSKQIRFFFSLARASANKPGDCEPYNLLNEAKLSLLQDSNVLISKSLGKVGSVAPLLLSDYRPLESNQSFRNPRTEPVLQTFEVPVDSGAWIQNLNDDTDSLMLDLTFSPSREQKIIIDDIGFVEQ